MAYEAPTIRPLGKVAELTLQVDTTIPSASIVFDPSVF